jgi:hypothetical protein
VIVFDLRCANAHVFEAWFGSTADYDSQAARGLIACPICDNSHVAKALMAPAIPAKGNRGSASSTPPADAPAPAADVAVPDMKSFFKDMAAQQAKIEATSDYVGTQFADEARAIHHGESEARSIYGETTPVEAEALRDEGVAVWPLPFRTRRADA